MDLKKSLEERRRRKWRKYRHNALNGRQQRKEILVSDLSDEALHKHESNSSSGISSSRKKKIRRRAMIFEKADVIGESETELSSVILNRTVEDKVTFQSETESHPLNVSDISYELSV